jgi:hypothetical protein
MAVGQRVVAAIGNVCSCQYGNRLEETGIQRVRRWFRLAQGGEHSVQHLVAYRHHHALPAPGADRRVELRRRRRGSVRRIKCGKHAGRGRTSGLTGRRKPACPTIGKDAPPEKSDERGLRARWRVDYLGKKGSHCRRPTKSSGVVFSLSNLFCIALFTE